VRDVHLVIFSQLPVVAVDVDVGGGTVGAAVGVPPVVVVTAQKKR